MNHTESKAKDLKIAYIGGGSRGWAWSLMTDLALDPNMSGIVSLYDIDYDAAKRNEVIGNRLSARDDAIGKWKYEAVRSLQRALTGADFVVISILPGTFQEMASDVHEPEKYGIYQSVGDSTGPGGIMRALRTIPMFVEIAEHIRQFSPDAWVINYTNPMAVCTWTLYETFPGIKAIGCCHEVFSAQKLLTCVLKDIAGIEGARWHDVGINVLGINHFSWIDQATWKGIDLMTLYREFVDKYDEQGYGEGHYGHKNLHKVKFDLSRKYGLLAASGDRHSAEFMPLSWYLSSKEQVERWGFSLTTVDWRIAEANKLKEMSARLAAGEQEMTLRPSGEEAIDIIKALTGLGNIVTNMNVPNKGQMEGLPLGAIVETNAVLSRDSLKPVIAGRLPVGVESMVTKHILNQQTVLQAGITNNESLAFQAFLNDPLVAIEPAQAERLFGQMLKNTAHYLPGWKI